MRAVQQTLGRRAAPPRGAARPACAPAAAAAHTAVDADVPADYGERPRRVRVRGLARRRRAAGVAGAAPRAPRHGLLEPVLGPGRALRQPGARLPRAARRRGAAGPRRAAAGGRGGGGRPCGPGRPGGRGRPAAGARSCRAAARRHPRRGGAAAGDAAVPGRPGERVAGAGGAFRRARGAPLPGPALVGVARRGAARPRARRAGGRGGGAGGRAFCAIQFLFDRQWRRLRAYANRSGVSLVGDMPIYVGAHSADVWCRPRLWQLGPGGVPSHVSGTPPDAFSATGQLWGSPLYAWGAHAAEGYAWWAGRLGRALALHDTVRIDHFRGLAGYWSVEAGAATALGGRWKQGPGLEFFRGVERALGGGHPLPLVAEDLGVITADVVALRDALGAPGMAVLQFGWEGGPGNPHLPHSHAANAYVYPGTHDNDTTAGWYAAAGEGPRAAFRAYLGTDGGDPAWDAVTMCLLGPARTVVVPMQDVLRLGSAARMNTPGVAAGNWAWRAGPGDFANHGLHSKLRLPRPPPAADPPAGLFASPAAMRVAADLRALVHRYNRLADGQPAVLESE